MRKIVNVRCEKYRRQAADGEMPPRQREKGALTKMESTVGRAHLFTPAMRCERLTPGQIRNIIGEHRTPRRYIRHGGQAPATIRYGRIIKQIAGRVRRRFEELGWRLPEH
jgi:hypothetical protein